MLQRTLPAGFIAPCLPTKATTLPSGSQWLHEIKHDGFRVIARKGGARGVRRTAQDEELGLCGGDARSGGELDQMTRRKREIAGLRNERYFPHLVEFALPPGGFRSVFERRIPVRFAFAPRRVCRTAVMPMLAPRCLGSAAMVASVSAAAVNSSP